jgi:hypothetical protein
MPSKSLTIILEHDDPVVPFTAFITVAQEAVELLRGVDCAKAGTPKPNMSWDILDISMRSPIALTLQSRAFGNQDVEVVDPFLQDVDRLEKGELPKYLNPEMQIRLKKLVSVINHGIRGIRLNSDSLEVRPTLRIAAKVDELTNLYYEFWSIEGKLDVISVHGKDSITVWDARWHCAVKCLISDEKLSEAKDLLGQGVSVRGRIKCEYNRPKEVTDVLEIRSLGYRATLPQAEDIAPVDLTGGSEPADYLRGADDD